MFAIILLFGCGDKTEDTGSTLNSLNQSSVACENNICIPSGTITEDLTLSPKISTSYVVVYSSVTMSTKPS